jgi:ATP:dephospho-CoA triphosphoribosyl transferase
MSGCNAIVQEPLRRGARVRGAVRKPNGLAATLLKASPKNLAILAVKALVEEAELTPKPALADGRGPGAQADLSLSLMRHSAHHLAPFFELMALTSLEQIPTQTLREELGTISRWAEHRMLVCTGQVNNPSRSNMVSWVVGFRCGDGCGFARGDSRNCETTCLLARLERSETTKSGLAAASTI